MSEFPQEKTLLKLGRCPFIKLIFSLTLITASAILLTYPLIRMDDYFNPSIVNEKQRTSVPQFIFYIWYFEKALSEGYNPLKINIIQYPDGVTIFHDVITYTYSFTGGILNLFIKNLILTHNLLTLFFIILTSLSIFIFLRNFKLNFLFSLFGSIVFISSPIYLWNVVLGHVNFYEFFYVPLIFIFLLNLEKTFTNVKNVIILGALIGLQLLTSQEFSLYLFITILLFLFYKHKTIKGILKNNVFNIVIFLLIVFSFLSIYIYYLPQVDLNYFRKEYPGVLESGSFNLKDFIYFHILPTPFILPSVLYLINKKKFPFLIFLYFFYWVYAFGIHFPIYIFLSKLIPLINSFITPARILFFAFILNSLFVSYFLQDLFDRIEIRKAFKTVIIIVTLLMIIFINRNEVRPLSYFNYFSEEKKFSVIYEKIKEMNGNFSIVELPLNERRPQDNLNIIYHEKNLVCGSTSYVSKSCKEFIKECGYGELNFSNKNCLNLINNFNLKYVVYHNGKLSNQFLKEMMCVENRCLYEIII